MHRISKQVRSMVPWASFSTWSYVAKSQEKAVWAPEKITGSKARWLHSSVGSIIYLLGKLGQVLFNNLESLNEKKQVHFPLSCNSTCSTPPSEQFPPCVLIVGLDLCFSIDYVPKNRFFSFLTLTSILRVLINLWISEWINEYGCLDCGIILKLNVIKLVSSLKSTGLDSWEKEEIPQDLI